MPVPSEIEALSFLDNAYNLGIRFFDTAPSYGYSEERLGKWLKSLSDEKRATITVATKFGEFWDFEKEAPFRKYDYQSLKQSLDYSLKLLGRVEVLLVHGFTKEVYDKYLDDILRIFDYGKLLDIKEFGFSVSDPAVFEQVIQFEYKYIQIPHNILKPYNINLIKSAQKFGKFLVINRPFGMGELLNTHHDISKVDAYKFVIKDLTRGVILTGTKSKNHLKENINAFQLATKQLTLERIAS